MDYPQFATFKEACDHKVDDKQRLTDLERKIAEMEDVLLTQADLIGEAIAILSSAAEGAESEVRRAVWRRGRG